jgi:hypothetical protein
MFLTMLAGSLVVGASLFAAATFSEGALVASRTAAQVIGWLFVLATLAGAVALRRHPSLGKLTAAGVTLASGALLLYVAHFEWSELHAGQFVHAAELKTIEVDRLQAPSPALAAALGMKEIVIPDMPRAEPVKTLLGMAAPGFPARTKDSCSTLGGVESLQCSRCSGKEGLSWLMCQESARLEYCQGRPIDEATCPSPIPASYPG